MQSIGERLPAIAVEAGRIALSFFGKVTAELKPDTTLVSKADRAVEEFLIDRLVNLLPNSTVISEERCPKVAKDATAIWIVDPIDGSSPYGAYLSPVCAKV